ncbi:MgtC/SapB family protein [Tellurirhabdus rosea]|uniref:MgtC/SapB family protein n=1 Tax=Tellurirhabdus rosea TaxID=2674997 RepID=UPI002257421A|nr:MgtC/SapB family protein [Tellurirhabdus rosea]
MDFYEEDIYKLLLALLLGGAIGAEREYRSKSAGLRTMIMICVGSTLFTLVSHRLSPDHDRIAANIVNGIGFLGAGIIFREDSRVKGLTTAATVWAVSAIGMAIGGGFFDIALVGFGLIIGSLLMLSRLSVRISQFRQTREYRITTPFKNKTLNYYDKLFEECGLTAQRGPQLRLGSQIIGRWKVEGPEKAHEKCIKKLLNDPDVKEFEF